MSDIKIIKLDQNYLPGSNKKDESKDINLDSLIDTTNSSLTELDNLNENEINLPDSIVSKHEFNLEDVSPDNINEISLDGPEEIDLNEPKNDEIKELNLNEIVIDSSNEISLDEPSKKDDPFEISLDELSKKDDPSEINLDEPSKKDDPFEINLDEPEKLDSIELNSNESSNSNIDNTEIILNESVNQDNSTEVNSNNIDESNNEQEQNDTSTSICSHDPEIQQFQNEHDSKLRNILKFYDNINHDKSNLHMYVLTGGSDKELESIMTTNYNINDQNIYLKTLEYIDNINSDVYSEYLESLQNYYVQRKNKRNLKKNNYFIDDNGSYIIEDKSTGNQEVIKPPKYFNTKEILIYLSKKLNNISYQIRNLRDYFLTINLDKKPKNYEVKMGEFEKFKSDYYLYYNNYQIFNQYNDIVNKITEDNNKLAELYKLHRQERIKYYNMYSQISQLYNAEDATSASVIIDDYLNSNTYKEIIKSIEEIRNKNINNIDFIILELPEISQQKKSTKKKKTLKLDLSEDEPTESLFEPQSPEEPPRFGPRSPEEPPTFGPRSPEEPPTDGPRSPEEPPTDGNISIEGLHTPDELPEMTDVLQDLKPENDLDTKGLPDVLKDTQGLDLDELPDLGDDIEGYQQPDEMPETEIPSSELLDVDDGSKALSKSEEDETVKTIKLFDTAETEKPKKPKSKKGPKKKLVIKSKKINDEVKESELIKAKGKGHSKSKKIPKLLHEGNEKPCKFPFKHNRKYYKEEDGCVDGKTGKWCATEVDKDQDYKPIEWGYCKENED